ncbi:MAG: hypothetical protein NTV06_09690 [candidate division Zixibacteria bacterium]|nr:hypothetical protein [candidate division Zixibacteria bacterium]
MQNGEIIVDSKNIDYGNLVGREIRIRTEQFPYKLLSTKVLAVTDNNLVIDRSGDSGRINQLIGHQCIEVLVDYRGEPIQF